MSSLRLKWGGNWINPSMIRVKWGGGWVNPTAIRVKWGGNWVTVYQAYVPMSISGPASTSVSIPMRRPAQTSTWTPGWSIAGGNASKTYSWSRISGSETTASGTDTLNPTFSATGYVLPTKPGVNDHEGTTGTETWRLTVSDGTNTITKDFTNTVTREGNL